MIKDAAPKNAPIDTTHGEFKSWDTPVGSYTGQWADERADGICRLMKEDGILVEGQFKGDRMHGFVREIQANGGYRLAKYANGTIDEMIEDGWKEGIVDTYD